MLTKKEEDELFEVLVEKHEILMPETCCMLRDFLKRADVPQFDYFKLCHTLRFIYGLSAEQSHRILEKTIKDAETCLDASAKRALSNAEKRGLFYTLSAFGISAAKISEVLKIPLQYGVEVEECGGSQAGNFGGKKEQGKNPKTRFRHPRGKAVFRGKLPFNNEKSGSRDSGEIGKTHPRKLGCLSQKLPRGARNILFKTLAFKIHFGI